MSGGLGVLKHRGGGPTTAFVVGSARRWTAVFARPIRPARYRLHVAPIWKTRSVSWPPKKSKGLSRRARAMLKNYTADGYVAALEQFIKKLEPAMSSSRTPTRCATSRRVSPRVSAVGSWQTSRLAQDGDTFVFVRQLFKGKLNESIATPVPALLHLRAGRRLPYGIARSWNTTVEAFDAADRCERHPPISRKSHSARPPKRVDLSARPHHRLVESRLRSRTTCP